MSFFNLSAEIVCGFFIASFFMIFILWEHKRAVLFGAFILLFSFGLSRFLFLPQDVFLDEEVSTEGRISSEVEETEKIKRFRVNNFLVITGRYSDYEYGDKVKITGAPDNSSVFLFPEIEKTGSFKRGFYGKVLDLKNTLRGAVKENFSPPKSAILGAMTLGDKHKMSEELKEKLNTSGLRHITAVSGMHIALIGAFLMIFFTSIGIQRFYSLYISVTFLFLFILMIGFPASAIRAGVMGGIYMFSERTGRMSAGSRNLLFAASAMLLVNPLLVHDYGFKLSFLAVFGIIHFAPLLKEKISLPVQKELKEALFIATSAYIFTFPFLLYNFNQVSLVSVFSNIAVFPFVYLIMVLGFLFLILSVIFPFISFIVFIPLWVFLSVFVFIMNFFSSFPYLKIDNLHWGFPLLAYSIFFFFILKSNNNII